MGSLLSAFWNLSLCNCNKTYTVGPLFQSSVVIFVGVVVGVVVGREGGKNKNGT